VIFSDELNHASIIDGSRLSGARIVRFALANPADLEKELRKMRLTAVLYDHGWLFSMDGDIAPWMLSTKSRTVMT